LGKRATPVINTFLFAGSIPDFCDHRRHRNHTDSRVLLPMRSLSKHFGGLESDHRLVSCWGWRVVANHQSGGRRTIGTCRERPPRRGGCESSYGGEDVQAMRRSMGPSRPRRNEDAE
jgi:hypothetical protein